MLRAHTPVIDDKRRQQEEDEEQGHGADAGELQKEQVLPGDLFLGSVEVLPFFSLYQFLHIPEIHA